MGPIDWVNLGMNGDMQCGSQQSGQELRLVHRESGQLPFGKYLTFIYFILSFRAACIKYV